MRLSAQKITPCLWFDGKAEDAADLYVSVFPNSEIVSMTRYTDAGQDIHGQTAGKVMVVDFVLDGQPFVGLNGGPQFKFDEAVSFQIPCKDQKEVDYYWEKLTADGGSEGPCGWLKDRFGLSWQVVPNALIDMLSKGTPDQAKRVTDTFMQMKKFDIAALERAFNG